mmetsp:Transcript_123102/g.394173  ORF Transcript_123102/g.394173 Transcript_123102/m.394173 type:complete len:84 (-) Transcript_123102:279-530(-)
MGAACAGRGPVRLLTRPFRRLRDCDSSCSTHWHVPRGSRGLQSSMMVRVIQDKITGGVMSKRLVRRGLRGAAQFGAAVFPATM